MKSPELLLPAGTLDKMRTAYALRRGCGVRRPAALLLRARNNEFKLEELGIGIQEAHALGKKLFVASNLMPHNAKVKTYMARHAAGDRDAAGRADHGRPRPDRHGARALAGDADAPFGAGQYRQLRRREILESDSDCRA